MPGSNYGWAIPVVVVVVIGLGMVVPVIHGFVVVVTAPAPTRHSPGCWPEVRPRVMQGTYRGDVPPSEVIAAPIHAVVPTVRTRVILTKMPRRTHIMVPTPGRLGPEISFPWALRRLVAIVGRLAPMTKTSHCRSLHRAAAHCSTVNLPIVAVRMADNRAVQCES